MSAEEYADRLRVAAAALADAQDERTAAILAADAAGIPKAHIAGLVGLSRMQVHRITTASEAAEQHRDRP